MNGFIPGSRGTLMMDIVASAMILVVPLMIVSIKYAKSHKYQQHKRINNAIGLTLLVTVILFEIEVRFFGWRQHAEASSFYDTILFPFLFGHIAIAVTTTILWAVTLYGAWKHFPDPPRPGTYGHRHHKLGAATAFFTVLTSITGWIFYWMAFLS